MTFRQLRPRAQFEFNGLTLTVQRNECCGDGRQRLHVSHAGRRGSVTLPGDGRVKDYCDPLKFRHRRRWARGAA